jgi:hypothetical protein
MKDRVICKVLRIKRAQQILLLGKVIQPAVSHLVFFPVSMFRIRGVAEHPDPSVRRMLQTLYREKQSFIAFQIVAFNHLGIAFHMFTGQKDATDFTARLGRNQRKAENRY